MDYYREKYREFQLTLTSLDEAYRAAVDAYVLPMSQDVVAELDQLLNEYESRRDSLRTTAEALNMGAAVVNSLGGRLPSLSIPGTLGFAPALPLAAIIAVSTAATLIYWGQDFTRRLFDFLKTRAVLDSAATPEQRERLAQSIIKAQQAVAVAESSSLGAFGGVAGVVKWGAIALAAFLAYRAFARSLKGPKANPDDDVPDDDDLDS